MSSVRARTAIWLAGSVVGAAVIAAPDWGPRLFSLSRTHGPSVVDLVGILVLLASWPPVIALLWSARSSLHGRTGRVAASLFALGAVVLVITIGYDMGATWGLGVALMLGAQMLALYAVAVAGDSSVRRSTPASEERSTPVDG